MNIEKTKLDGVFILTPRVFKDNRGYFTESYNQKKMMEAGFNYHFVQDNHSYSQDKGVLRGIHFQINPKAQTKLVRCTRGKILDVVVDLRKNSPTYKQYVQVELSSENFKQLLIPKGFGHAFLTLTDDVEVQYKVDEVYSKEHDRSINYKDPELNIEWPDFEMILSDKDKNAPLLSDSDINFL
ncbi:dTDP-4-dehydrorhamnose 3,5-epimerase [Mycoplasmatota bacterium]|nr:dTDP-4-dehydrorhamnose 3,5-epimerase [Mycoplasmatota bacterium]